MAARNEKGQFVKGESGNPNGRSRKEREIRYYEITQSAVTYEDWREVVKKAVVQAKRGDSQARKFLADYLLGLPTQKQEISGNDGERIEIRLISSANEN